MSRQNRKPMTWKAEAPSGVSASRRPPAEWKLPDTLGGPRKSGLVDAEGRALDSAGVYCCDVLEFMRGQNVTGQSFIGYASCANLAQDGLMRLGVETLADEMIRKWGHVSGLGADDTEKLDEAMKRLRVRRILGDAAGDAGYFGVGYVFLDTGEREESELMTPLFSSPAKLGPHGIIRLSRIDPVLMSPGEYNASDPLSRWYYRPRWWYVQGRRVHTSRILRIVQHEPPFLLLPVYNFGGIPVTQLALDYLVHFTGTRESAARLLKKFSLTVFKANLSTLVYGAEGAEASVMRRLKYFAANRDNDGVFLIDKEEEDVTQINTPLSGTTEIVRQALEMLAAVFHMPVTKFLGISPGGMNATGEYDARSWYDYAGSQQESMLGPAMTRLLELLQAQTLGRVDHAASWEWNPMWTPSDREKAETVKLQADTAVQLVGAGIASPEQAAQTLGGDEDSPWTCLADTEQEEILPDLPGVAADSDEGRFIRLWRRMTRGTR